MTPAKLYDGGCTRELSVELAPRGWMMIMRDFEVKILWVKKKTPQNTHLIFPSLQMSSICHYGTWGVMRNDLMWHGLGKACEDSRPCSFWGWGKIRSAPNRKEWETQNITLSTWGGKKKKKKLKTQSTYKQTNNSSRKNGFVFSEHCCTQEVLSPSLTHTSFSSFKWCWYLL